jgi:menaquinone-specific isochorismate synthase
VRAPPRPPGSTPTGLAAVRLPLGPGPAIDPFDLAGSDGIAFLSEGRVLVGLGCAATVPLPHGLDAPLELEDAARGLASIACDDHVGPDAGAGGSGVMAFGALPFDRSAAAALTVPEVIFGVEPSGQQWVTVTNTDRSELPTRAEEVRSRLHARLHARLAARQGDGAAGTGNRSSPARIAALATDDSFEGMVDEALAAIHRGQLSKVVLARQVEVTTGDVIDIAQLLRRWHHLEPDCAVFSLPGTDGQFVGASPELLIERTGLRIRSRPLAGTTEPPPGAAGGTGERILPTELLASAKDAHEHRLVVEAIAERLGPLCAELEVPAEPYLVRLHSIVHLGTALAGTLSRSGGSRPLSAIELVGALHPTPAVGGVPTEAARSLIARLEPGSRGRYAGPVGYMDAAGDGKWMLGIRAVSIRDRTARLAAGVGIVDGSDPQAELAETNLKFNAVFDALAPGLGHLPVAPHRRGQPVS